MNKGQPDGKLLGNKNVLYAGINSANKGSIPETLEFQTKKPNPESIKKDRAMQISIVAAKSAAGIIADSTVSRKTLNPGLNRQPKTMKAVGIGGLMKASEKANVGGGSLDGSEDTGKIRGSSDTKKSTRGKGRKKNEPSAKEAMMSSVSRTLSQAGSGAGKHKDRKSGMSISTSLRRSLLIEKGSSVKRGTSTITSNSDSEMDDDVWGMEEKQGMNEDLENEETVFEMATVEIDVNDAQENMDDVLTKMLAEGRVTTRQRAMLSEKFELFLQSLVSFQEREVEVIEFLNMKADILKLLNNFVANEEDIAGHIVVAEEEVVEEEAGGILSSKTNKDQGSIDKKKGEGTTRTDSQGLSVMEMSASTIRETLLAQKNKIEMQEHMKTIHVLELRQLEFEKALLAIHYSRMTKPADVQREMKELKRTVHDLQMEVSQNSQEIQEYEVNIATEEKALQEDEAYVEKLDIEVLTKQMQVQTNANKPVHLAKEADRDANKLEQLNDDYDNLCNRFMEGMEALRGHQGKLDGLMGELHGLIKEEGRMAQLRKHSLHETEALVSQMEALVSREQQLLDRAAQMADKIGAVMKTRKKLQEDVYAVSNETNKALRESAKLERTLRMTSEAHINAKLAYDKMRLAFDSARPKDDANNWEKLTRMLQREIGNLKLALNEKLDEATIKADLVDKLQKRLNELYDEQLTGGKELQNLIRTTVRKRRERQEKSEQCIKLEGQVFRLGQDSKMQKLVLDDCARTERDLRHSMDYIKMQYNKIKIARAALMNDLISAKQKVTEQAEKFKICNNEVESYTNQCMEREREIHRAHYLTLNASLARDSVRNHALRCRDKFRFFRNEKMELLLANKTLRKEVMRLKMEVNDARVRFETATHECNLKAMKVRERTEEICTINEKIKASSIIILKGNRELTIRQMEHTKLSSLLTEIQKHALNVVAKQPDDGKIIKQIEILREEFYAVSKERRSMEVELNDVTNPARVRNVNHDLIEKRETLPVLQNKLARLEEALALRECQGLEKELILKQVTQITEDSMEKANLLKQTYKEHTSSLVSLRKQFYHMASKIDAMISETSIAITQADLAEKRHQELTLELNQAEKRFCMGLPPVDSMLEEWKHLMWRKEMLRRSNENSKRRFLNEPKTLKGSQIVMERLRPHKKMIEASLVTNNNVCRFPRV